MNRIEALELLSAKSPHDRFRAARALESLAIESDRIVLKRARQIETDAYVIKRLERAIENSIAQPVVVPVEVSDVEDIADIVKAQRSAAIEWIASILLHEIGSKIGLVELSALKEIPNYSSSKTQNALENLQEIFEGISKIKSASSLPVYELFSLADLLDAIIDFESINKNIFVSRVGERPAMVLGDSRLIRLAICNGIRNGIEAVLQSRTDPPQVGEVEELVVSWGITDKDYWVTVIDQGPGISNSERFFNIGTSTKNGHLGYGLAIAKQAMDSLSGVVRLYSSPAGGATYEIRWGKPN